jgi:predicted enzyme related to lactoylglutathione lyase
MGTPYVMWTRDDVTLGGVGRLPAEAVAAGAPPHWLAYVATPDVDATAARAVALGGTVRVPPTDIPTVGRFAVLADPQGAQLAVFTPSGEAPGHDGPARVSEFSWHELATSDHAAAFAFYSDLFGWTETSTFDMGEMGLYQMYGRSADRPLGGMFNKSGDMPGPPMWIYYLRVADAHAAAEKVKELGGQVLVGPMEVPGGDLICQCFDPQGALFAVHESRQGAG